MFSKIFLKFLTLFFLFAWATNFSPAQNFRTAFLHADDEEKTVAFIEKFRAETSVKSGIILIDNDLSNSAKRALGYENLFNLSLSEAKNLGSAIDCDFYFIVRSRLQRRSSFQKNVYFEAFAVVFLVSAKTGRLIFWERPVFEHERAETAEKNLTSAIPQISSRFFEKIKAARNFEQTKRDSEASEKTGLIAEEIPENEADLKAQNFRIPLPFKSLRPTYTEAAAKDAIEAKIDVLVEIDEKGFVRNASIERWAGFGLDEEALVTVKKLQFRSALRDGKTVAVKFLLRYNFRRPLEDKKN